MLDRLIGRTRTHLVGNLMRYFLVYTLPTSVSYPLDPYGSRPMTGESSIEVLIYLERADTFLVSTACGRCNKGVEWVATVVQSKEANGGNVHIQGNKDGVPIGSDNNVSRHITH